MKISSKFTVLLLVIFSFAIFTFVTMKMLSVAGDTLEEKVVNDLADLQTAVGDIEVEFLSQVVEWKNILLHGSNPDDLEKYRSQFLQRSESVQALSSELVGSITLPEIRTELEKFVADYKQLQTAYLEALNTFDSNSDQSRYAIDSAVLGKARIPADRLQALSHRLVGDLDDLLAQQSRKRYAEQRNLIAIIIIFFVGIFAFAHWVTSRTISKPLGRTFASIQQLAGGDANTPVPGTDRKDEIGNLAKAVEQFRKSILDNQRLTIEQQELFAARESAQAEMMAIESERQVAREQELGQQRELAEREAQQARQLAERINALLFAVDAAAEGDLYYPIEPPEKSECNDDLSRMARSLIRLFDELRRKFAEIDESASNLNLSANELEQMGIQIMNGATQNAGNTERAAATADEVTQHVESVAVATGQMSVSIQEIAANAGNAVQVAERAVSLVNRTDASVRQLATSSADIGTVIKVITSIAEQTNLLALNATIEAARAGEAGKGFAVVANEVKELAKETARATEEIETRIASIQSDTKMAVTAIGDINEIVSEISETQNTIAAAVEEQNATTTEINCTVEKTVNQNSTIGQVIGRVAETAVENRQSAQSIKSSATQLSTMATKLQSSVARFVTKASIQAS